jgi:hypothetical protein
MGFPVGWTDVNADDVSRDIEELDGNWYYGVPMLTERKKDRANRLKTLGNAVVPQVVREIGRAILESDTQGK